jgi:hypothetical protein
LNPGAYVGNNTPGYANYMYHRQNPNAQRWDQWTSNFDINNMAGQASGPSNPLGQGSSNANYNPNGQNRS